VKWRARCGRSAEGWPRELQLCYQGGEQVTLLTVDLAGNCVLSVGIYERDHGDGDMGATRPAGAELGRRGPVGGL
jgi:hypothetical protein